MLCIIIITMSLLISVHFVVFYVLLVCIYTYCKFDNHDYLQSTNNYFFLLYKKKPGEVHTHKYLV